MVAKWCLVYWLVGVVLSAPENSVQQQWENFKISNQKSYGSPEEEAKRFQVFQNNLQQINEHNEKFARGETTFEMGVNKFADLKPEEFKNRFVGGLKVPKSGSGKPQLGASLLGLTSGRPNLGASLGSVFSARPKLGASLGSFSSVPLSASQQTTSNNVQLRSRFGGQPVPQTYSHSGLQQTSSNPHQQAFSHSFPQQTYSNSPWQTY